MSSSTTCPFEVYVSKDTFKFNAAHFVAFPGYRERLHGHNYRIGVRCSGQRRQIGADGYVIDFGCIKAVCKDVCKRLNEHFLVPMLSNVLKIRTDNTSLHIECEDKSVFCFPLQDCALLPIVHATAEELAVFLWSEILKGLHADYLLKRGIDSMEVTVAEAIGQEARFRWTIPTDAGPDYALDVASFVSNGEVVPMPCPSESTSSSAMTKGPLCTCKSCNFSEQLEHLARAINKKGGLQKGETTVEELSQLLKEA